jgi:hypothetical protein
VGKRERQMRLAIAAAYGEALRSAAAAVIAQLEEAAALLGVSDEVAPDVRAGLPTS